MITPFLDFTDAFLATVSGVSGFKGRVLVIEAFFDESGDPRGKPSTIVAGFLYDANGLTGFRDQWAQRIAGLGLSRPFRASDCHHGNRDFQSWPDPARQRVMDDLARIIVATRTAGFVSSIYNDDFTEYVERNPKAKASINSPYALCVMRCLSMVGQWADKAGYAGDVFYWFEQGAPHEKAAADFLRRTSANPELKARFRIGGYSFIPKSGAPQLCSGDLLAWEWNRNMTVSDERWTDRMQIIRSDKSHPLYWEHMKPTLIGLMGMFNSVYALHQDED
jgi:hypothetical protein